MQQKSMPRIISFLFFLLFIYTFNAKAENIKGILLSQKDSISIPYAHIGVKGTGIGTVSNINGEFELKYHFNSKSDTIVISHIEYEKKYIPLHLLLTDTINHITLKKYKHLLGDVIILPEKRKKSIIDSVILNLKNNYADKLYQCEAFYREVKYEEKSKQYSRLIEAAINIQDKKINSSLSKIKCSILEFRKSNNYTKEHWGSKFIKKLIDYPGNKLQTLLERNPIRSYFTNKQLDKFNPLKQIKENKMNSLSLEKVIQNNKQDIYIFKYLHSKRYTYTIYINKQDYAIVRFDIEMNSGKSPIYYSSYSYKRINNKYYPIYFSNKAIEDYLSNSKGLGWYANSLSFVNYSTDRKNFNRLRSKHLIPKDLDLYKQVKEYHPHFWENYNILLEEPINQKIVTDLESEKEIEKQFQNNSMK